MTYHTHARIAALVAAGFFTAAGVGVAYADTTTSGNGSILGGNQIVADLDAPVNACGNAIAVLGLAGAQCTDSGAVVEDDSSTWTPEKPEKPETPDEPEKETPEEPETPEKPEKPGYGEEPGDGGGHDGGGHDGGGHDDGYGDGGGHDGGGHDGGGHDGGDHGGGTPEEPVSPPATDEEPPAPGPELAQTGTDGSALSGLLAGAAAAIAAGAGLLLFGRRRARA
ncbi:chaplin [Nocardiopsis alborubida]|uniref:Chaplin n=1 Tax=Nocardiopsis alborubida TaxID=146802 RepID=A0A7X6MJL6_9ACTN|nr:chaplin [Nocardiopsis alborubida]NKZ00979.1 chaplin [Nocardiopsis alborubida]